MINPFRIAAEEPEAVRVERVKQEGELRKAKVHESAETARAGMTTHVQEARSIRNVILGIVMAVFGITAAITYCSITSTQSVERTTITVAASSAEARKPCVEPTVPK